MSGDNSQHDPRVYFAAERTMLAWMRTGIAMMGFGFVVARFGLFLREMAEARASQPDPPRMGVSLWVGTSLVLLGVWVNLASAVRHFQFRSRFERGEPFLTPRGVLYSVISIILAILGIGMTLYLVLLSRQ